MPRTNRNWASPEQDQKIRAIESSLQSTIRPVSPRAEYIQDLQLQLDKRLNVPQAESDLLSWQFLLIAVISLLTGTFLIVLGIRAIVGLLEGLGRFNPTQRRVFTREASAPSYETTA